MAGVWADAGKVPDQRAWITVRDVEHGIQLLIEVGKYPVMSKEQALSFGSQIMNMAKSLP